MLADCTRPPAPAMLLASAELCSQHRPAAQAAQAVGHRQNYSNAKGEGGGTQVLADLDLVGLAALQDLLQLPVLPQGSAEHDRAREAVCSVAPSLDRYILRTRAASREAS